MDKHLVITVFLEWTERQRDWRWCPALGIGALMTGWQEGLEDSTMGRSSPRRGLIYNFCNMYIYDIEWMEMYKKPILDNCRGAIVLLRQAGAPHRDFHPCKCEAIVTHLGSSAIKLDLAPIDLYKCINWFLTKAYNCFPVGWIAGNLWLKKNENWLENFPLFLTAPWDSVELLKVSIGR